MEPFRDDQFVATLESLRPEPSPEFTAELDERAAAGFPRPERAGTETGWERLVEWLRQARPGKLVLAGGGTALAIVAVAAVFVAGTGSNSEPDQRFTSGSEQQESNLLGSLNKFGSPKPAEVVPEASSAEAGESAGSGSTEESSNYAPAEQALPSQVVVVPKNFDGSGPYASRAHHRDVEYAAEVVLGTRPEEVGDAAGKVFDAVHQYRGIVLGSSVSGGSEGDAGAEFELLIPSARLSGALATFSDIAEVHSRHESSNDITAPTVTTGELLQDSHARIDGLLNQLADTDTETEREAVEAQLRSERRHAAGLKSQLTNLQRRAGFSHVSLRIESGGSSSPSSGGSWDVGDAIGDAGQILAVAAAVAVVGLAVLAPIALIALLLWLGNRAWVRQRRERALG
jgi:hypothetical protein